MDFVGPLPITPRGNQYLVTAIDYGTGWAYAVPIPARSGLAAVKLVKTIIENNGFPHSLTTNNGSEFNGHVFKNFLSGHQIRHNRISPYHPQSNGLVERFHGTLVNALRKYCIPDKQSKWDLYLSLALFGYQTSKTAGLERSPFYMCYGVKPTVAVTYQQDRRESTSRRSKNFNKERMEQLQKINQKATMQSAKNEKVYHKRNLQPGELVLRKFENCPSKLHPQWDGPFVIHSANSNGSFRLQSPNGHILKFTTNGDRLKRYYGKNLTLHFNRNVKKSTGILAGNNEAARRSRGRVPIA
jgi:hypothetical protein